MEIKLNKFVYFSAKSKFRQVNCWKIIESKLILYFNESKYYTKNLKLNAVLQLFL